MATCPACRDDRVHEAAVEITRWTAEGTETLYRCPHCGREESSRALNVGSVPPARVGPDEQLGDGVGVESSPSG